jgi:alkylation response protein AidB-like acyl-CoA dehydrogenase
MSTITPTAVAPDGGAEFIFSPEQEELRATLRRYLGQHFSRDELRRVIDLPSGYDPAAWTAITAGLGLAGIVVPQDLGGDGGGAIELAVIAEELGQALYCSPWFGTCVLALTALAAVGGSAGPGERVAGLIGGLAAGETTATVVSDELIDPQSQGQVVAETGPGDGSAFVLDGTARFVVDGGSAEHLVVLAGDEYGGSVYLVADRSGVQAVPLTTLDLTRRLAEVRFTAAPAYRLGEPGTAAAVREQVAVMAGLASVAESLGGMQFCVDQASAYVKTRFQFGRPIGSFQAVKHKLANMLVHLEICRTAVQHAAWTCAASASGSGGPGDHDTAAALAVHLAQAQVGDSYLAVTAENIQTHGWIGFTYDHDAHLYYRRAKSAQLMLGSPAYHRDRVADLVGI